MLREVFNVADSRSQSGCGDGPAVNFDNALCDVLISGDGFEQGGFACSVPAQQTVNPRFVDGQRDVVQHRRLPVLLCYLFQFNHEVVSS